MVYSLLYLFSLKILETSLTVNFFFNALWINALGQTRPFSPSNPNGNIVRNKKQSPIHFEIQKILSLKQDANSDKTPIKEIENREIEEILKTTIHDSYSDIKSFKEKDDRKGKAANNIQKAVHFNMKKQDPKNDSNHNKKSTNETSKTCSESDRKLSVAKDSTKVEEVNTTTEAVKNKRDYGRPIIITRPGGIFIENKSNLWNFYAYLEYN